MCGRKMCLQLVARVPFFVCGIGCAIASLRLCSVISDVFIRNCQDQSWKKKRTFTRSKISIFGERMGQLKG